MNNSRYYSNISGATSTVSLAHPSLLSFYQPFFPSFIFFLFFIISFLSTVLIPFLPPFFTSFLLTFIILSFLSSFHFYVLSFLCSFLSSFLIFFNLFFLHFSVFIPVPLSLSLFYIFSQEEQQWFLTMRVQWLPHQAVMSAGISISICSSNDSERRNVLHECQSFVQSHSPDWVLGDCVTRDWDMASGTDISGG